MVNPESTQGSRLEATYSVTFSLGPLEGISSLHQVPAPSYTALGHSSQTPPNQEG